MSKNEFWEKERGSSSLCTCVGTLNGSRTLIKQNTASGSSRVTIFKQFKQMRCFNRVYITEWTDRSYSTQGTNYNEPYTYVQRFKTN